MANISLATYAAPYTPAHGSDILERLPSRNDPAQQELAQLRRQHSANPHDVRIAVTLARRYIQLWRDGGDPRYLGYAQGALSPWWALPRPPLAVLVLRATLLQSTHQFSAALVDLDTVVQMDPGNAQAWLIRATVLQVLGEYPQAKASCVHLYRSVPSLILQACLSNVASVNGQAAEAYRQLQNAFIASPNADPGIKIWVLTLLAEMAERHGDAATAQAHFRQALSIGSPDTYLLAAYADFLLHQHQPAQVAALLNTRLQVDALLLRYAMALKALHSADTMKYQDLLRQRFDAARLRGDTTHQREQARFELNLAEDADAALKVAQQNWSVQREPADTRLLLEAAVAAHDKAAARPVLEWIKKTGFEDRALWPLVAKLDATGR